MLAAQLGGLRGTTWMYHAQARSLPLARAAQLGLRVPAGLAEAIAG